jgi:hypothetical protein
MYEDYYSTVTLDDTIEEIHNSALSLGGFEQVDNKKIYKPGIQCLGSNELFHFFLKKTRQQIFFY